ncbi:DMT family transporter [Lysinibacillus fusiformis]|jgi:drug/metabolite transporter (DMT)-like permease|uniref:DMT family transporter n=1 Tax=Lysinibacillus TaxID=400634 RepID=UPI0004D67CCD|nr:MULTISPECIES: DMT family transporter [Lysinibacillus]MDC6266177.1 DMT family transporter [Lysinibacillus sphaericus]AJK88396.1 multidrug transporter [Lysinibacillus fusiformis]KAB0442536.1 EamA/RhaT family transporter [Lysinibacillus fusiformis]KGA84310.1 multidrug transporter [Lysinibacillus fusiformis]KHK49884.1 multidrug transporter [Lysinibacillus sp. A1]
MSIQGKANVLMVIVTMFWGLSYTFMVMGLETLAVYNVVALRCIIAFLVAGLIFYKRMIKVNGKTLKYAAIQGFLLFIVFALSLFGLQSTSVSNAGFILSLTVVLVPIFSSFIDKKLPSRAVSFAIICTMIGITVLTAQGSFSFHKGDLLVAIAALCYSIYLLLNSSFTRNVESISYGIYQLGFAGIYALILTLLFETPTLPNNTTSWIAILGLGIICSAFCFVGQTVAQQYTSATHTGLIFSLEPIFAAMFAMMFIGEGLTVKLVIGGSFILIGNLFAQLEHFHVLRFIKKDAPEKVIH